MLAQPVHDPRPLFARALNQAAQQIAAIHPAERPEERSAQGPFGPTVPVPDDADVYTQLAAYLGRRPQLAEGGLVSRRSIDI